MFYEIRVPKTQERDAIAAAGLVQALIDTFYGDTLFLVRNGNKQIAEYVVQIPPQLVNPKDPNSDLMSVPVPEVAHIVQRFYPQAIVEATYPGMPVVIGDHERWLRFVRSKHPYGKYNPILPIDRIRRDDPFALLAQLISQTPIGDVAYYGVQILSPRRHDFKIGAGNLFFMRSWGFIVDKSVYKQQAWNNKVDNLLEAEQQKASEGAYKVFPYVCYRSSDKNRLQVAESIARIATNCGLEDIPFSEAFVYTDRAIKNGDDARDEPRKFYLNKDYERRYRNTRSKGEDDTFLLTPRELASLWHLPDKTYPENAVHWYEEKVSREIPDQLKNLTEGVLIGTNVGGGRPETTYNVRLPSSERTMHTFIMGRVGTGKSSLMLRMIHEDIKAGRSVVVIDPHGAHDEGLVRWTLQHSIPDNRIDDVVVVDLTDMKNPPPINPLLAVGAAGESRRIFQDFVSTLARVYEDADLVGTRMEIWLRLALRTIALDPKATLSEVRTVFRDGNYRASLLEKTDQLSLLADWDDFLRADKPESTLIGIFNRISRFMESNETLAMVCHPRPIHYGKLAAQNKIILVSAGGGVSALSYRERMALTSVIVSQVMEAALCGMYPDRRPVTMYIDETRNFVNAPLDVMLREVRKFNLPMVMSSQGMSALGQKAQDAIDESVGTFIGFEMSDHDAAMLKPYVKGVYTTDELQTLGRFTAAVSTRYKGDRLRAFELKTHPPITSNNAKDRETLVRQRSVENYMPMSYGEVLDSYKNRYANNRVPVEPESDLDDFIKRT